MEKPNLRNRIFFYLAFLVLTVLAIILLRPFFSTIVLLLISIIVLKPVYKRIFKKKWVKGRQRLAVSLTLIAFILVLVIPVGLLFIITFNQLSDLFIQLEALELESIFQSLEETLNNLAVSTEITLDAGNVANTIHALALAAANALLNVVVSIASSLPNLLVQGIIFLVLFVTLLPEYDNLVARFEEISPLGSEISSLYYTKTTAMVSSLVLGIFLIAIIQGAMMGFFYWLAGLPYVFLLALVSMLLAMLPVVGISYLTIILATILILTGQKTSAVIILFGFYGVVNWVDILLRPKLISKDAYLNFALVLLGIIGGVIWAGFLGLFYGPVILLLLVTTINIYSERFAKEDGYALQELFSRDNQEDEKTDVESS
ncbi:MAG: AI-2E family transporter [Chloroflexota bacterium]|nr:AI-2E family transporter [Chloroflexota bacterium]